MMKFYLGEGKFTTDPIAQDFFGCAGVAEIPNLQEALVKIGYAGHRHHECPLYSDDRRQQFPRRPDGVGRRVLVGHE